MSKKKTGKKTKEPINPVTFRIDAKTLERLGGEAEVLGGSRSAVINRAIHFYLDLENSKREVNQVNQLLELAESQRKKMEAGFERIAKEMEIMNRGLTKVLGENLILRRLVFEHVLKIDPKNEELKAGLKQFLDKGYQDSVEFFKEVRKETFGTAEGESTQE